MINKNRTTTYIEKDNVGFLQYKKLNEYPWLMNAFSTRKGGVSKGQYAEMNLSFTVGDDPETVKENFRIFGDAIGIKREQMVYAAQTHTKQCDRIYMPVERKEGKYLLDLPMANCLLFEECGVRPENIILPDLCTSCNKELLHSHRASGGKRGGMCAFLMIRESD